jgi:hypothetical protein
VRSSNHVAIAVGDFHGRLGIEGGGESLEARRWVDAAAEAGSRMLETGAEGVDAVRRLSGETLDRAQAATNQLSKRITRAHFGDAEASRNATTKAE